MTPPGLAMGLIPATNGHKSEYLALDAAVARLEKKVAQLVGWEKADVINRVSRNLQQQEEGKHRESLVAEGIEQLAGVAERINALAAELEAEMLKFKEIATEVNGSYRAIQYSPDLQAIGWDESRVDRCKPANIWEVHSAAVPQVKRRGCGFILCAKTVDLFQTQGQMKAEKRAEASQRRREALERWLIEQSNKIQNI